MRDGGKKREREREREREIKLVGWLVGRLIFMAYQPL